MACECGCGKPTVIGAFRPGHDQKLRTDIERRVGGLLALRSLIEVAEDFVAGKIAEDTLTRQLRAILSTSDGR